MEEVESEELLEQSNYNTQKIMNLFQNNEFSTSEDPIPHLINPAKEPLDKFTSMSYIISSPKFDINIDQINNIAKNKISLYLININLQKYNSTPLMRDLMIINNLIRSKETHFTSLFKDYLISDYNEEFLRGYFNINECKEVLPKFYEYYKNYLHFFCKGTFSDFKINNIIQEYGENHAEVYYNLNYLKKERVKKKDKKENIDEKNFEETDKTDSNLKEEQSKIIPFFSFFTKSVENSIKNMKNSYEHNKSKKEQDKELSNIKPLKSNSRENTINLPDNSTVSIDDVITKRGSIINIIDLMNKKIKNKKNNSNFNKKKKMDIILIDNKKLKNKKNVLSSKHINSFSKTTSNLKENSLNKIKDINNKSKKSISKNKGINIKINNVVAKNNKILSSSNYIKYIDILKTKKNIKKNIPKNKRSHNDLILSTSRNMKSKKSIDNINSFNTNDNMYSYYLFSNKNISSNLNSSKNKNHSKINLSLKIKNFYQKIQNVNNNSNYPLSSSRNKINKNIINKKSEPKEKSKSKSKININNNYYYKKNNSKNIKKTSGISFSPKNNYVHNKSLSTSTVNNCNININNNIILSNNYFNNKNSYLQQQLNNSTKKLIEKNIIQKRYNINNNSRPLTSRNIKIDLEKFKTEENIVNSIIVQSTNNKILKNKNNENNNIQYSSFRKSNNNEIIIKQRNLFKIKKNNININNKRNLTLKDMPVINMNKTKRTLNKNNSSKKIFINDELNYTNKTYKNLYMKSINNNNQKKIIFDYKKK